MDVPIGPAALTSVRPRLDVTGASDEVKLAPPLAPIDFRASSVCGKFYRDALDEVENFGLLGRPPAFLQIDCKNSLSSRKRKGERIRPFGPGSPISLLI